MGKLVIFSGAGISAESGLATFRSGNGETIWSNNNVDEVCNIDTWKDNFEKVHAFYSARRGELKNVKPNAAHLMVAEWQKKYETIIITQNGDDLFERAGCKDVIHIHGFLQDLICQDCGHGWNNGYEPWYVDDCCSECSSGAVKPNVVFFGEMAPKYLKLYDILADLQEDDIFVVMGTSGNVIRIATLIDDTPGLRILNNLAPSNSKIDREKDQEVYHHIFYEPATSAVLKIDAIVEEMLGAREADG